MTSLFQHACENCGRSKPLRLRVQLHWTENRLQLELAAQIISSQDSIQCEIRILLKKIMLCNGNTHLHSQNTKHESILKFEEKSFKSTVNYKCRIFFGLLLILLNWLNDFLFEKISIFVYFRCPRIASTSSIFMI